MRHFSCSLAVSICALVAISGCGGSDGSKTPSTDSSAAAQEVKKNALAVITDPNQTCKLLTDDALQVYVGNKQVKDPIATCNKQVKRGRLPKTARVKVFDVKGDVARVGYITSQVTGLMIFLRQDGQWLMNAVTTIRN